MSIIRDNRLYEHDVLRKIVLWIPLMLIALLNGLIRGMVLNRFFADVHAHQVSTFLMIIWIFFYTTFIFYRLHIRKSADAWVTGILWLTMTIVFETGLGYFVFDFTLKTIFADYDLLNGRLWPLVLISILITPLLCLRLHKPTMIKMK